VDERPEFLYNAPFLLLAALGRLVIVNLSINAAPSNRAAAADRIVRLIGFVLSPIGVGLALGHLLNGISITALMQIWAGSNGPEPVRNGCTLAWSRLKLARIGANWLT